MKKTKYQNPLIYPLLRVFLFFLKITPKKALTKIAHVVSELFFPLLKKSRAQIKTNIANIMHLPPHSTFSTMFAKQVLRHQVHAMMETLYEIEKPGSIEIRGLDDYKKAMTKALEKGKGVLILTAHLGSWEFVAHFGAIASGKTFHALAKPSKYTGVTRLLRNTRSKMGTHVLWTDRPGILKDMLQALKKNEPLGFVMDQKPDGGGGHKVDFLGSDTEFVAGPARIALKSKAPALAIFCVREAPWRYRLICKEINDGDREQLDEQELTALMAKALAEGIKLYPEQWTWNYKRWKFPTSKPSSSSPYRTTEGGLHGVHGTL